eukprot:TRINITY_DN9668_c0_g1_i1.p1 TRINITY_DN9668_c0_g1~~TRINITY_DN9668_c0_g1_i1.p1  ORF type:complete len:183 (-),score=18.37 TRINITY_DN9668_c0_g1_i1:205-753(-)
MIPLDDRIKIIDMGGATYDDEYHSTIINTRQYRAPEVILGCCQWDKSSDLWSIGCILLELYSGDLFFETHDSYEHLALIERACGPIPFWMADKAEKKIRKHFYVDDIEYFHRNQTYFDWPKYATNSETIKKVKKMAQIEDVIPKQFPELRDLLHRLLEIDPHRRISCDDALRHNFFQINYDS